MAPAKAFAIERHARSALRFYVGALLHRSFHCDRFGCAVT